MVVDEVISLFRMLVDEPDETFLTASDLSVLARVAHDEMRSEIADAQPKLILTRQRFVVSGATFYDLADVANATVLLGPGPLAPVNALRIHTVHGLASVDPASGVPQIYYHGANSESQLYCNDPSVPMYYLEGTVIRFSTAMTGTFEISYVPVSGVDWTRQTAGMNEFVDDFSHFHDLIALRMAEQYMVRDAEMNGPLQARLSRREDAWNFFVQSGRDKAPGGEIWVGNRNFWE